MCCSDEQAFAAQFQLYAVLMTEGLRRDEEMLLKEFLATHMPTLTAARIKSWRRADKADFRRQVFARSQCSGTLCAAHTLPHQLVDFINEKRAKEEEAQRRRAEEEEADRRRR